MSDDVIVRLVFDSKGAVKGMRVSEDLQKSLKDTKKRAKEAGEAVDEFNYKQNSGVIGNASAGRSFSKLAQTIGHGPNSLVAAYATLASNAFAVAAAFTALRNANQVELLMKGLEAQGARTGRTLSTVANNVRDITNGAISAADAMQATALTSAAGFAAKDVEALTRVATDASIALGRNLPDSMDRVIKGVTKLEPELLDELGLVTKLTEATNAYALAHNKSATSLTAFEKRAAFLEAIKKEGTVKYGGIADETGVNSLDRLAASFSNLTQQVFSFINGLSIVKGAVDVLANSQTALLGVLVLFGNTMKTALLGFLYQYAESAAEAAASNKDLADKALDAAVNDEKAAKAKISLTRSAIASKDALNKLPKAYAGYTDSLKKGIATAAEFEGAEKALRRSISSYAGQETRFGATGKNPDEEKLALATAKKKALETEVDNLNKLKAAEEDYAKQSVALSKSKMDALTAESRAVGQLAASDATSLAGNLKFTEAFSKAKEASGAYKESLIMASASAKGLTSELQITESTFTKGEKAMFKAKAGLYNIALGARVAGSALLGMVPVIGTAMVAFGILSEVYNTFIKSDSEKQKEKAFQALGEVLDSNASKLKELERINEASISLAEKTSNSLIIKSNALRELADAYEETRKKIILADKESEYFGGLNEAVVRTGVALTSLANPTNQANYYFKDLANGAKLAAEAGVEAGNKLVEAFKPDAGVWKAGFWQGIFNTIQGNVTSFDETTAKTINTLDQMDKVVPGVADRFLELSKNTKTSEERLRLANQVMQESNYLFKNVAASLEELKVSFKEADEAYKSLIKSKAPATSFDTVVEKATSASNAISRSVLELDILAKKGKATNAEIGAIMSQLGGSNKAVLDIDTQKALDKVDSLEAKIANLTDRKKMAEASGLQEEATSIGEQLNDLITRRNKLLEDSKDKIVSGVKAWESELRQLQLNEILSKSMLTLEESRLAKMQRRSAITAVDYLKQIDQENKVTKLKAQQVTVNMSIIRNEVERKKLRKESLEEELKNLDLTSDKYLEEKKITLQKAQQYNYARLAYNIGKNPVEMFEAFQDVSKLNSEIAKVDTEITESQKRRSNELRISIDSINNEITLDQARLNAMSAESQAILNSIIGTTEANLEAQKITIDNNAANLQSIEQANSLRQQQLLIEQNISDKINGRISSNNNELNTIKQQYNEKRKQLALESAATLAKLKNEREMANRVDNRPEAVAELDKRIAAEEAKTKATLDLEASLTRQAILDKVILDTTKEGLEIQQQSIEVLKAQIDLQETLLGQRAELRKSDASIIAKKFGVEDNTLLQNRLELLQAKEEYNLALSQFDIKVEGIKLEYALLEAQRINSVLNWKLQRDSLFLTMQTMGTMTSETELMISQMDAAISNMSQRSYSDLQNMAIEVARGELAIKKKKISELEAELLPKGPSVLNEINAAFANIALLRKTREETKATVAEKAADKVVSAIPSFASVMEKGNENIKKTLDTLQSTLSDTLVDLTKAIRELASTMPTDTNAQMPSINAATSKFPLASGSFTNRDNFGEIRQNRDGTTRKHMGLDLSAAIGTAVATPIEGIIQKIDSVGNGASGKYVAIYNSATKMYQSFSHLSKIAEGLKVGDSVSAGSLVGNVGNTGRSTGPHLHWRVKVNGVDVDPNNLTEVPIAVRASEVTVPKISLNTNTGFGNVVKEMSEQTTPRMNIAGSIGNPMDVSSLMNNQLDTSGISKMGETVQTFWEEASTATKPYLDQLAKLGPEGELVIAMYSGMQSMSTSIASLGDSLKNGTAGFSDYANVAMSALNTVQSILSAASAAKIANIEKEISAEQKRDGKSAQSVAKIEAMEKKKDSIARKQFNTNKKLMMAQAVVSTASAIAGALALPPMPGSPFNIALAGMIGAMGAAQIAIIAGTSYESANTASAISTPTSLSIGKRGDSVNLAQGASANAGGEIGYLRGAKGTGTNASNYNTIGSAYGGELVRGYGNAGFIVGEKGPEKFTPETPIQVTPANKTDNPNVNATINIQALDASGVEEILSNQKGNIIKMLREAANASGQGFLEDVNVNVYTKPNVNRL